MAKKRKKKQKNRILRVFMLVFLVYAGYIFTVQQMDIMKFHQLQAEAISRNEEKLKSNKILANRLSATASLQFKERIAREKLGMIKPGEIVYVNKNESK